MTDLDRNSPELVIRCIECKELLRPSAYSYNVVHGEYTGGGYSCMVCAETAEKVTKR